MAEFNMDVFNGNALDNIMDPVDSVVLEDFTPEKEEVKESTTETTQDDPEEIQTPSPPNSESSKNIENKSPLLPFAKLLEERGYFKLEEGKEISSFDDIDDLLNQTIKDREFAQLTDRQKEVLTWIESGVPEDRILQHTNFQRSVSEITDDVLSEEDEQGEALRKNILTQYYQLKGFDQNKIDKSIKRIVDAGEDIDEAKDALKELKAIEEENFKKQTEEYSKAKQAEETAAKEGLKNLQTYINTTKEIIPGLTIPKKLKDELYDKLTKPVSTRKYTGTDGKEYERPLDIVDDFLVNATVEDRATLAYYIMITDKFKKHDMLSTKKAKSNTEKQLEDSLRASDFKEYQKTGLDDLSFLEGAEF